MFLRVWGSFGCFLGAFIPSVLSFVFTEEMIEVGHTAIKPIGGVLQWCLSFCKFLRSAYMIMELN